MPLEQEPFRKYHEDKQADSFTVRLNADERELLNKCKRTISQPKDSTCLKMLAWVGAKVIHSPETKFIIETISSNKRKNERVGINIIE